MTQLSLEKEGGTVFRVATRLRIVCAVSVAALSLLFPLFGHIVVASVLTQSARDLTYKRRIHVTTSLAQVALRVEKIRWKSFGEFTSCLRSVSESSTECPSLCR